MTSNRTAHILDFLSKITSVNKEFTKKELFKDLLHKLYVVNPETVSIIGSFSLGSETSLFIIPLKFNQQ